MAKLKILSGKDVCKILYENGFVQVRQKGSHIIMQKKQDGQTITVPVPNHSEIQYRYTSIYYSSVATLERAF